MEETEETKFVRLTFVVSGQSVTKMPRTGDKVYDVLSEVLEQTGNQGWDKVNWEMRYMNGRMVDTSEDVGVAFNGGEVLFLNPQAGVGAARPNPMPLASSE